MHEGTSLDQLPEGKQVSTSSLSGVSGSSHVTTTTVKARRESVLSRPKTGATSGEQTPSDVVVEVEAVVVVVKVVVDVVEVVVVGAVGVVVEVVGEGKGRSVERTTSDVDDDIVVVALSVLLRL
jgi:hypothetical protein